MRVDEAELLRNIYIQKSLSEVSILSSCSGDVLGEMLNPALLQAALKVKNAQVVQDMIKHKADLNAFSMHGYTPLMMASMSGCAQSVSSLIAAGVDVNLTNKKGQSALWLAASNGHADVVKILAKSGADLNMEDKKDGKTPLMVASEFGHLSVVSALIKAGVDVNKVSPYGQTALSYGIVGLSRDVKILKRLVVAGADIHQEPQSDNSRVHALKPLVLAVLHRNRAAVKFLLSLGASGREDALRFAKGRDDQETLLLFEAKKSPQLVKKQKIIVPKTNYENMKS